MRATLGVESAVRVTRTITAQSLPRRAHRHSPNHRAIDHAAKNMSMMKAGRIYWVQRPTMAKTTASRMGKACRKIRLLRPQGKATVTSLASEGLDSIVVASCTDNLTGKLVPHSRLTTRHFML